MAHKQQRQAGVQSAADATPQVDKRTWRPRTGSSKTVTGKRRPPARVHVAVVLYIVDAVTAFTSLTNTTNSSDQRNPGDSNGVSNNTLSTAHGPEWYRAVPFGDAHGSLAATACFARS